MRVDVPEDCPGYPIVSDQSPSPRADLKLIDITVIIPAFNEVSVIRQTLDEVSAYFAGRGFDYEIIVAADGDDGTREAAAAAAKLNPRISVRGTRERRGKGRGIRESMACARGRIVGFLDADNKVPVTEFEKFEPWLQAGCELVIGSRALPDSHIDRHQPWFRQVGSRIFAFGMHAVVGLRDVVDTQCGFKFFHRDAGRDLFGRQTIDAYLFDVEILVMAKRGGLCVKEVPIRWRDDADSRLNLITGNVQNFWDLVRIRLRWGQS
jgi:dolichyl-phosphate beta-glucosyltransferase